MTRGTGPWRFRLPSRSRQQIARDVDEELAFHLELVEQELAARGVPRDTARAEATRQFGDLEGTRAYCRDVDANLERQTRRAAIMTELWQDLRYGARKLRTSPAFTAVAALTLALGIGANTAIFSVVHHLLLAPLPYPAAERLVIPWRVAPGGMMTSPSRAVLDAWRAQSRIFERVEEHADGDMTLAGDGEPEVVRGARVSPGFTAMLGVRPLAGRAFTAEDARPGAAPVVAIGSGLWARRFGGRADVLGRTIVVNDEARTVVAIFPSNFDGPVAIQRGHELWTPLPTRSGAANAAFDDNFAMPLARLRPDVADDAARRALERAAADASEQRDVQRAWKAHLMHPQELRAAGARRALLVLLGAVGLVLLIACANVANLLLTRAGVRAKEIAVRVALGGGRGRLVRQLLVESAILAILGGALGVLLAWGGVRAIVAVRPDGLDALDQVRLQPVVLGFSAALSLVTGVLFGLYPALLATRAGTGAGELIRTASLGGGRTVGGRRFRAALVAAEVALSAVILVGAGLLVRSVMQLERVDTGFDARNLLTVAVALPESRYPTNGAREAFNRDLLSNVRALPGVEGATLASTIPPKLGFLFGRIDVEGRPMDPDERSRPLAFTAALPDYFRVMRIRVLEGRAFTAEDRGHALIVNAALARKYWPNESAVGKRMRLGEGEYDTVVGVVADVAAGGLEGSDDARNQIYFPLTDTGPRTTLVVRTRGDPLAVVPLVKQRVLALDGQIPLRDVATAQALLRGSISRQRFNMVLLVTFAGLALVLAAIGLYGVVSYAVTQRTREIGIRVALGARPGSVQRAVVLEGARMTAVGLLVGVAGALALSRLLASLLFGVTPRDPATYVAVSALLGGVTLLACWLPARRAARVDPLSAIRAE